MNAGVEVLFREVQPLHQPFMWVILGVMAAAVIGGLWVTVLRTPAAFSPLMRGLLMVIPVVIMALTALMIGSLALVTEVHRDGAYARLAPFQRALRPIDMKQVRSCEIISYRPLHDYGGWGIRRGGKGLAYTARGDRGVLLTYDDNRPSVLIGSQTPDDLKQALDAVRP